MRASVFPSSILPQSPVWRALFPLCPTQMVRVGDRRYRFPAQISLWAAGYRSARSFTVLPRPMEKTVAPMFGVASIMVVIVGFLGVVRLGL